MMKTRTYAEILARQGEFVQAVEIYRELVAKSPADESLPRRLKELENLRDGVFPEPPLKSPRILRLEVLLHRITSRRKKA
jgi:hypothetical protein